MEHILKLLNSYYKNSGNNLQKLKKENQTKEEIVKINIENLKRKKMIINIYKYITFCLICSIVFLFLYLIKTISIVFCILIIILIIIISFCHFLYKYII